MKTETRQEQELRQRVDDVLDPALLRNAENAILEQVVKRAPDADIDDLWKLAHTIGALTGESEEADPEDGDD